MNKTLRRAGLTALLCSALAVSGLSAGKTVVGASGEDLPVETATVTKKAVYVTENSPETVVNGDFRIQDFANENCGWKDQGWGGFDTERGKITYAWVHDMIDGLPIGIYQDIAVEKNTDYYLTFNAAQSKLGEGRALTVGLSDPAAKTEGGEETDWTSYLAGQKCEIEGIGEAQNYYVAFNSGEYETVRLRFETQYMVPPANNQFGGFFLDDVSFKKITGEAELSLDLEAGVAEGMHNYVYIGGEGNTTRATATVTNLADLGLTEEDVTIEFASESNTDVGTVDPSGLVTAGTELGPIVVTATAKASVGAQELTGTASVKIRCIFPTDQEVYLDAAEEDLPFVTTGSNLLYNGDFEAAAMDTATADHMQKADNWRSTIGTWMNTEEKAGFDGSTGGKITWRWQNGLTEDDFPGFYQDVKVKANSVYQVSFIVFNWAGVSNGQNDLYIGYRDPNGKDIWTPVQEFAIATPDIAVSVASPWENYTEVTAYLYTGELSEIRLFAYGRAQAGHDGGSGWWFDNWELLEVSDVKAGAKAEALDTNVPSTLRVGGSADLKAYEVYVHDFRKDLGAAFTPTYQSADPSIAAIENGKIVAKKAGTVQITATGTHGELTLDKTYTVTVLPVPESLEVKVGQDNTVKEGRDQKITVTLKYSDGSTETISSNIVYSVSDDTIIAQKGNTNYLAGKKAGKATLTAKVTVEGQDLTGSVEVTVVGEDSGSDGGGNGCKGCKSSLSAGIGLSVIAGAAAALVLFRKKTR